MFKSFKKLKEQGLDVELRDIVQETPSQEELLHWIQQKGKESNHSSIHLANFIVK